MIDYKVIDITATSDTTSGSSDQTFERTVDLTAGSFVGVQFDKDHADVRGSVSLKTEATPGTRVTVVYDLTTPGASMRSFTVKILVVVAQQ